MVLPNNFTELQRLQLPAAEQVLMHSYLPGHLPQTLLPDCRESIYFNTVLLATFDERHYIITA